MSAERRGLRLELLGLTWGLGRTPVLGHPAFPGQWGWAGVGDFPHLGARCFEVWGLVRGSPIL